MLWREHTNRGGGVLRASTSLLLSVDLRSIARRKLLLLLLLVGTTPWPLPALLAAYFETREEENSSFVERVKKESFVVKLPILLSFLPYFYFYFYFYLYFFFRYFLRALCFSYILFFTPFRQFRSFDTRTISLILPLSDSSGYSSNNPLGNSHLRPNTHTHSLILSQDEESQSTNRYARSLPGFHFITNRQERFLR